MKLRHNQVTVRQCEYGRRGKLNLKDEGASAKSNPEESALKLGCGLEEW